MSGGLRQPPYRSEICDVSIPFGRALTCACVLTRHQTKRPQKKRKCAHGPRSSRPYLEDCSWKSNKRTNGVHAHNARSTEESFFWTVSSILNLLQRHKGQHTGAARWQACIGFGQRRGKEPPSAAAAFGARLLRSLCRPIRRADPVDLRRLLGNHLPSCATSYAAFV